MVFLFPALHRRVGTLLIYRCSMSLDIVFICCYPIVYFIAQHYIPKHEHDKNDFGSFKDRNEGKEGGKGIFGVWEDVPVGIIVGIVVMLVVKALAGMTWGYAHCLLLCFNGLCFLNSDDPLLHHSRCNMILVTASAPSPRSLGTVNSMAQMAASLARAIGPPIYSYVHSLTFLGLLSPSHIFVLCNPLLCGSFLFTNSCYGSLQVDICALNREWDTRRERDNLDFHGSDGEFLFSCSFLC